MAWVPCCRCDERFVGEAQNLYLSVYYGDERESYRYVVCAPCADTILEEWRSKALQRDATGEWGFVLPGSPPVRLEAGKEPPERLRRGRRAG